MRARSPWTFGIGRLMKPWYVWRPWQLARRARVSWIMPRAGCQELRVAWGVSLLADTGMTIGRSIQTTGVHDPAVGEILARLIQPGNTVVDAGAHVGYMTMLAAIAAGRDGRVVAWEPHPELFHLLERNVARLAGRRQVAEVLSRNAALAGRPGTAELLIPDADSRNDGTSSLGRARNPRRRSLEVRVETIDDVIGGMSVDVMKLDVEGSELDVLSGAYETLTAGRIRHIVFEDHEGSTSGVVRLLKSLGYEIMAIGWSIRGLRLGAPGGGRLAADYEAPSYLATLAPGEVQRRCSKAGWLTLNARFADRATPHADLAHHHG